MIREGQKAPAFTLPSSEGKDVSLSDFKGRPVAQMLEEATLQPIKSLEKAVETKNPALFAKAFDQLTGACNSCHQAAGFQFISIRKPSASPFTNQDYEEPKH